MKRIKRILICSAIILVCYLLETTVFRDLAGTTVIPNLLVVVTSAFGFMRGKKEGILIGFFCGLLKDLSGGGLLGFYALIYMLIGYCNGFFKRVFYDEDVKLPLVLISASDLSSSLIVYFCLFMLKNEFDFKFYFLNIIMPELVYTIVITLALYQVIRHINRWLEEEEKRSASKFV